MPMQQPPFTVYLWTFDEYHRTAVRNGHAFVDKGHFGEGSQPDCRGAILPTEDDDRMTCHGNQERSPLSRSITYVQKKLFLVNDESFSIEHCAIVISANNDGFEGDASLDSFLWDQ